MCQIDDFLMENSKIHFYQFDDFYGKLLITNLTTFLQVWNSCAFSIQAAVHSELDKGRSSLLNPSGMSSRNKDCVQALVRFCSIMSSNFGESKVVRSHALRLLSLLTEIDGLENPSILDIDAFGLLVGLTYSVPSLFNGDHAAPLPSGNLTTF